MLDAHLYRKRKDVYSTDKVKDEVILYTKNMNPIQLKEYLANNKEKLKDAKYKIQDSIVDLNTTNHFLNNMWSEIRKTLTQKQYNGIQKKKTFSLENERENFEEENIGYTTHKLAIVSHSIKDFFYLRYILSSVKQLRITAIRSKADDIDAAIETG